MKRRQFISKTGALALASLGTAGMGLFNLSLAQSARPRITDIRVHRMRTLGETGMMESPTHGSHAHGLFHATKK